MGARAALEDWLPGESRVQTGANVRPLTSRAQQQFQSLQNPLQTASFQSSAVRGLLGDRHDWSEPRHLPPVQVPLRPGAAAMLNVAGGARRWGRSQRREAGLTRLGTLVLQKKIFSRALFTLQEKPPQLTQPSYMHN